MACVSERAGKGSCTRHDSCSNNRRNDDWTWPKQAGRLMMRGNSKLWRGAVIGCAALSLLFSAGCALFLGAAGGAGGYLIRKGEEGDAPSKKETSKPAKGASLRNEVDLKAAFAPQGEAGSR